jgi:tetratricopeptide (TPR) repeat protein
MGYRVVCVVLVLLVATGVSSRAATLSTKQVREAVKMIRGHLAARRFDQALTVAQEAEKGAPHEARFLYLPAEILVAFDRDGEARRLRERARALNPLDEEPHYYAGDLLQSLGRRTLAAHEYRAILDIPPDGRLFDANAYLRLGGICEICGRFAEAATMYEKGLEIVTSGRAAGQGLGVVGATPDRTKARSTRLRRKAAVARPDHRPKIVDRMSDRHLGFGMTVLVKDGKLEELRRALAAVEQTLTMNVEPAGFRLFDAAPASVVYDKATQQLRITLNGQPCCKPTAFVAKADRFRIAVQQLDCVYIFELDTKTGTGKKVARYEKDYRLTVHAGLKLQAAKLTASLDGKEVAWGELLDGHVLDTLPKKLAVRLVGKRRSGEAVDYGINLVPEEPPIQPLPPENKQP